MSDNNGSKPEFRAKAILPSQMQWLCDILASQGVKRVVESGRANGFSTEWLALSGFQVLSIDRAPNPEADQRLRDRLWKLPVTLTVGDSRRFIDSMRMYDKRMQRLAVLIDGPKGEDAISLANRIIQDVVCVAIHDVPTGSVMRKSVHDAWDDVMFSDGFDESDRGQVLNQGVGDGVYSSSVEYAHACSMAIIPGGFWDVSR